MRPYVVVAPGYTEKSWGVRTLHLLCHTLNQLGAPAYMHLGHPQVNPRWETPTATPHHVRDGIVIYPEVETRNPLRATRVVRWLLNRPGYITGRSVRPRRGDFVVAFSPMIDDTKPTLNLQTPNEGLFHPFDLPEKTIELFYVGKGRRVGDPELVSGRRELTREWPATHVGYADLLRRTRTVVSYDTLSGVNYEATLCGALCIVIPNGRYLREDIAKGELGLNGIAWGTDEAEIERAQETLPLAYPEYLRVLEGQEAHVRAFIATTQARW